MTDTEPSEPVIGPATGAEFTEGVPAADAALAAARADLASATTVAQIRTRTLAYLDLLTQETTP